MRCLSAKIGISFLMVLIWIPFGPAQDAPKRPGIWTRLTKARVVIVGTVKSIAAEPVEALPAAAAKEKQKYWMATVQITEPILGVQGTDPVKVGFTKAAELKEGQEACFILTPHFTKSFHTIGDPESDLFNTDHRWFDVRTKILRRCAVCLDKPVEALKAQEPIERLLAAALLVSRYRDASVGTRTEPIDTEESKLLLRALRDADWGKEDPGLRLHPQMVFQMLGLTEKDGWKAPAKEEELRSAAEDWLIDHNNTYRIRRFVADK